ncbi:hypothetical protein CGLO_17818 [Colletotrichum gloeosporioides Cg-14]|uniref:Uncharacterized protein n=1 Tax=Colletotrichum gloeosporioides (strain Cg-14) TaxID=1237896 RepID=T0L5I1_COLGC|nr:hypothetical protein CGLO_17818 [Colletotrichum gloeosporioides Cg-14]
MATGRMSEPTSRTFATAELSFLAAGFSMPGGEFDEFLDYINKNCGGWYGGWVDMDSWAKQYGMQQKDEAICGKADRVQWPKL